ncbi:MAG: DNA-binding protein [Cytophagaceae bacterium SCN 52-12]|nr:MAG: DNA-binding protein [Cytophagaceae bacterium SCN 52-12]
MENHKIFFAPNLKFLRERVKLTQQELANKLEITRSKLNALESGQTTAPRPEDYLKLSDFFKLSIDTLLKVDLSKLGELKLRDLQAGNDVYITGSNIRILAVTVDANNRENVEYVPVKAKAGYRSGYSDPDYIASLPRFSMPNLPPDGSFRMFPTTGDSMLPLPEGSDIICRYVADWTALRPGALCIVILSGEQDFVFKKVTVRMPERKLLLESLNPVYDPYEVPLAEVLEIWKYHSYQSSEIPSPSSDVQHISTAVNEILRQIKVLRDENEK